VLELLKSQASIGEDLISEGCLDLKIDRVSKFATQTLSLK